jgi:hypothetical protein
MRLAKCPRVEIPCSGLTLAPVKVRFPKNAPVQVGLVVLTKNDEKLLYPQQKRKKESTKKIDGERREFAHDWHLLPA